MNPESTPAIFFTDAPIRPRLGNKKHPLSRGIAAVFRSTEAKKIKIRKGFNELEAPPLDGGG